MVERVPPEGPPVALLLRGGNDPSETFFPTSDEHTLQVGFVVYPAGGEVARHVHLPLERTIAATSEVLVVRSGRCELDLYDADRELVATRELAAGDVAILVGGGHGIRMLEDTVLLEVKQGPYYGEQEKERF